MGARGWGEAHRVRFTPALLLSSPGPLPMERTRNVLLDVLYFHERLTRLLLSILSRGRTFHSRERSYKLARFYGLSSPLRIFRLREPSCGQ